MSSITQLKNQLIRADGKVIAHERQRPSKNSPGYKAWKKESDRLARAAGSLRGQLCTEEMKRQAETS